MRGKILTAACLLGLAGIVNAGTYTKPLPTPTAHPQQQVQHYYYDCNWSYYPAVQYVIHKLRHYHVKSIIYPYQLRIVIPDYVLYQSLTNHFVDTAKPPMNLILALMHYLPGAKVRIIGYSDNIASVGINQHRTMLSAQKIAGVFWSNGYPAVTQTVSYQGGGESNPIASNKLVGGMAANRRVEIVMSFPHHTVQKAYYK